jgi:hypothetical protein
MSHQPGRKVKLTYFWLFIVAVLIGATLVPYGGGISERSPHTRELNRVKSLLLACRAYAADHEGEIYPPSLESLYPDYIDLKDFHLAPDNNGSKVPVLYHPGYTSADQGAVVLEHPLDFNGKRIVGYVGGHVTEERVK